MTSSFGCGTPVATDEFELLQPDGEPLPIENGVEIAVRRWDPGSPLGPGPRSGLQLRVRTELHREGHFDCRHLTSFVRVGDRTIESPLQSVGGYDPTIATIAVSLGDLVVPEEGLDVEVDVLQHASFEASPGRRDGPGSRRRVVRVHLVDPCGASQP